MMYERYRDMLKWEERASEEEKEKHWELVKKVTEDTNLLYMDRIKYFERKGERNAWEEFEKNVFRL